MESVSFQIKIGLDHNTTKDLLCVYIHPKAGCLEVVMLVSGYIRTSMIYVGGGDMKTFSPPYCYVIGQALFGEMEAVSNVGISSKCYRVLSA